MTYVQWIDVATLLAMAVYGAVMGCLLGIRFGLAAKLKRLTGTWKQVEEKYETICKLNEEQLERIRVKNEHLFDENTLLFQENRKLYAEIVELRSQETPPRPDKNAHTPTLTWITRSGYGKAPEPEGQESNERPKTTPMTSKGVHW